MKEEKFIKRIEYDDSTLNKGLLFFFLWSLANFIPYCIVLSVFKSQILLWYVFMPVVLMIIYAIFHYYGYREVYWVKTKGEK